MFAEQAESWSSEPRPPRRGWCSLALAAALICAGGLRLFLAPEVGVASNLFETSGAGVRSGELWRLLSGIFWRDDPVLLAWDAALLILAGGLLESVAGARVLALHWLVGGVCGGLAVFGSSAGALQGAGPANAAVVLALLVRFPRATLRFSRRGIPLFVFGLLALVVQLMVTIFAEPASNRSVGVWGLCLAGVSALYLGWLQPKVLAPRRREERERRHRKREVDRFEESLMGETELDRILAKINRMGMEALSAEEKRFLQRMSQSYQGARDR